VFSKQRINLITESLQPRTAITMTMTDIGIIGGTIEQLTVNKLDSPTADKIVRIDFKDVDDQESKVSDDSFFKLKPGKLHTNSQLRRTTTKNYFKPSLVMTERETEIVVENVEASSRGSSHYKGSAKNESPHSYMMKPFKAAITSPKNLENPKEVTILRVNTKGSSKKMLRKILTVEISVPPKSKKKANSSSADSCLAHSSSSLGE